MNLPLYIARRYFFSGKISGVVHIIAGISMLAIIVGTFAQIAVLSTQNGLEVEVGKLFNSFNSDLKISPAEGKYFSLPAMKLVELKRLKHVVAFSPVIEENVILKYRDNQTIAAFRAMESSYLPHTGIDSFVSSGNAVIEQGDYRSTIVGAGVAAKLGMDGPDDMNPIQVFFPKQGNINIFNPEDAFRQKDVIPAGIFQIINEFDSKYIVLPLNFARELSGQQVKVTSYEFKIDNEANIASVREEVEKIAGKECKVLNRFQQQPTLYKVMQGEKFGGFLILSFILLIAAFNMVGALLMLAIEKKKDMMTLVSLGASLETIERIIMFEGMLLSGIGGAIGIFLGWIVGLLQQEFGFIQVPGESMAFTQYPVDFRLSDFALVMVTVLVLGFLASYYPAKTAFRRLAAQDLRQ